MESPRTSRRSGVRVTAGSTTAARSLCRRPAGPAPDGAVGAVAGWRGPLRSGGRPGPDQAVTPPRTPGRIGALEGRTSVLQAEDAVQFPDHRLLTVIGQVVP